MMKIYQVDAFTEKPFSGNPAGVCVLDKKLDEKLMQNIAREMSLSETAFLVKVNEGYDLRWFTPNAEVDLCGWACNIGKCPYSVGKRIFKKRPEGRI